MNFTEKRDHWVALALSVAQPFVVTWIATVLIAVIGYAATASAPMLGDAAWSDAFHLGSSAWLLGLGSTVSVGAVRIAFKPLLLTIALLWLVFRTSRRAGIVSWADVCVVAATGALAAAAAGIFALDRTFVLGGVLGAALVGAGAAMLAWRSWLIPSARWWDAIERGWRYAWPLLLVLGSAGLLLMAAGFVAGHSRVDALYEAYVTGRSGFVAMTVLQGLYLPNFIVWALCIASGAPLHVGEGSVFSAFGTTAGPLPGIPFLGALPEPGWNLWWLAGVPVAAGVVAGLLFGQTHKDQTAEGQPRTANPQDVAAQDLLPADSRQLWRDLAAGIGLVFLVLTVCGALASGSLGSGRMMDVGPNAPLFALLVCLEAGVPMALVLAVRWKRNAGAAGRDAGVRGASLRPEAGEAAASEASAARRITASTLTGGAGMERLRRLRFSRTGAEEPEETESLEGAEEVSAAELADAEELPGHERTDELPDAPEAEPHLPRAWLTKDR